MHLRELFLLNGSENLDRQLLNKVIQRKREALRTFRLEQAAIAGLVGGFVGLIFGGVYTTGLIWHIANVFLYAIIGAAIGYFNSKSKKRRFAGRINDT